MPLGPAGWEICPETRYPGSTVLSAQDDARTDKTGTFLGKSACAWRRLVKYALSAMILASASIGNPSYTPEDWHIFLLTVLIMIIHGCISSMPTRWIAQFNSAGSTFNIIALIIVIIIIPAADNRTSQGLPRFNSNSDVWGHFYDGTDFPTGISVLMSFIAVIWTMSGYDAPFHLAEECSNANIASPRAIVLTSGIGGVFGWFLQLVVAYTVVNIDDVLDSDSVSSAVANSEVS